MCRIALNFRRLFSFRRLSLFLLLRYRYIMDMDREILNLINYWMAKICLFLLNTTSFYDGILHVNNHIGNIVRKRTNFSTYIYLYHFIQQWRLVNVTGKFACCYIIRVIVLINLLKSAKFTVIQYGRYWNICSNINCFCRHIPMNCECLIWRLCEL